MGCSNNAINVKNEKKKEIKESSEVIERNKENNGKEENKEKKEKGKIKEVKKEDEMEKSRNEEHEEREEKLEKKERKIERQCIFGDPSFVPDELVDTLRDCVARIEIKSEQKIFTGFFIKISLKAKEYKFLFTCYHSIPKETIDSKLKISIYYGKKHEEIKKKMVLDRDKRFIKTYEYLDITIIEIKEEDYISENRYLYPDMNYKIGLKHYQNSQVYTAGYPNVKIHKGDKHYSAGIITAVDDNGYDFEHNCDTKEGSSGCPIINYDKFVVGIHYGADKEKNINCGTFIGKIINELFLEEKNINPLLKDDSIEKEDKKENNGDIPGLELGFAMVEQLMKNQSFINMTSQLVKNEGVQNLMSNMLNQPQFENLKNSPEEVEKFMGEDKELDIEGLFKYNLGKFGYSKNDQDIFTKKYFEMLNNPNLANIGNIEKNEDDN